MAKISLHVKNQHPTFQIICFRTLSYFFPHLVFLMSYQFSLHFQNWISQLMWHSKLEKNPCMQKISILPSNLFILEPYFSWHDFDLKIQKLQTSIKSYYITHLFMNHIPWHFVSWASQLNHQRVTVTLNLKHREARWLTKLNLITELPDVHFNKIHKPRFRN